jgi:hypothetical protein
MESRFAMNIHHTLLALAFLPLRLFAAHYIVTNANEDSSAGSLRAAIVQASAGDSVTFKVPGADIFPPGDTSIEVSKDIGIFGNNAATGNRVTLMGNGRVFRVIGGKVTLTDMLLTGGGIECPNAGSTLSLDGVEIRHCDNSAIVNFGIMIMNRCTIDSNRILSINPEYCGAGIRNSGDMKIMGSALYDNSLTIGAHFIEGQYWSYETDARGAGVNNSGSIILINCTICRDTTDAVLSSNDGNYGVSEGAGIFNRNQCTMIFCTVCQNISHYELNLGGQYALMDGVGVSNGGMCSLLNTAVIFNYRSVYGSLSNLSPSDFGQTNNTYSMNSFFGFGHPLVMKRCDTGEVSKKIAFDNILSSSGGGYTKTIALTKGSSAIGAGVRAGYYSFDTVIFNAPHIIYRAAYYDVATWRAIEDDSIIPAATVTEITIDQRGQTRAGNPCIGAYEYIETRNTDYLKKIHEKSDVVFHVNGKYLFLDAHSQGQIGISLLDLGGRKIFSRSITGPAGNKSIIVPLSYQGPMICAISVGGLEYMRKVVIGCRGRQ